MSAQDPGCRIGAYCFLVLVLAIPSLVIGCGDKGSSPAPVDAAQEKKVQQYMSNYREEIRAANKAKAEAKAAGKKTP
jgi:hypothetical protein